MKTIERYFFLYLFLLASCQKNESINPKIKTDPASNIGISQVTLKAEVEDMGIFKSLDHGFLWSETPGININVENKLILGQLPMAGEFSIQVSNLKQGITYYARAFVADGSYTRIFYGEEISFTTLSPSNMIQTTAPLEITTSTALLQGEIKSLGQFLNVQYGFVWSASPMPTIFSDGKKIIGSRTGVGEFSNAITGLSPNTTYYVRAFIMDESATSIVYGNEVVFKTLP